MPLPLYQLGDTHEIDAFTILPSGRYTQDRHLFHSTIWAIHTRQTPLPFYHLGDSHQADAFTILPSGRYTRDRRRYHLQPLGGSHKIHASTTSTPPPPPLPRVVHTRHTPSPLHHISGSHGTDAISAVHTRGMHCPLYPSAVYTNHTPLTFTTRRFIRQGRLNHFIL